MTDPDPTLFEAAFSPTLRAALRDRDPVLEAADPLTEVRECLEEALAFFPELEKAWCIKRALTALPLIRAAALEEAAQVAEEISPEVFQTPSDIAVAIRALKEQP